MRITYNAPFVLSFTILCTVVLLLDGLFVNAGVMKQFFVLYPSFSLADPLSYLRLFSHAIGHAHWGHLLGNFTFILLIGPIIEEKYGTKKLAFAAFSTAIITGLLHLFLFANGLLGASGIVFMLIVLSSITNFKKGELPLTFVLVCVLFIGKEIIGSFGEDHVSQFAHIIGGVCGGFFGWVWNSSSSDQSKD